MATYHKTLSVAFYMYYIVVSHFCLWALNAKAPRIVLTLNILMVLHAIHGCLIREFGVVMAHFVLI
jgi:hypothetical protein